MDSSGGDRLQEVYIGQRRLELRHRAVGGDVVRGTAVLGDVQSGCECCTQINFPQWRTKKTLLAIQSQLDEMMCSLPKYEDKQWNTLLLRPNDCNLSVTKGNKCKHLSIQEWFTTVYSVHSVYLYTSQVQIFCIFS